MIFPSLTLNQMYTFKVFVRRKITKNKSTYKMWVSGMTEIVFAHDQKHNRGHYFLVGPNASPKRTTVGQV